MIGKVVVFDLDAQALVEVRRFSAHWWRVKLRFAVIDALDWFRSWKFCWHHNIVAFKHGRASPGCVLENNGCVEYRWEPERGGFFYCTGCLRRVDEA